LLLPLVLLCSGALIIAALRQPAAVSVALGQTATVTCKGTIGDAAWYQQKPGRAPVLLVDASDKRAPGIPEQFSGSSSGSSATLTISRAQAEDDAEYHCQSLDISDDPTVTHADGEDINVPARDRLEGRHSLIIQVLRAKLLGDMRGLKADKPHRTPETLQCALVTAELRQPAAVSEAFGQTATVTCEGMFGVDSWYQQKSGLAPVLLVDADCADVVLRASGGQEL
ncbi:PREDICTED: uncharacterized protein LOC101625354, partial [Condylura cristata]|uniref:uncharacterized protein LOC101625354 n=1 Tax=Condylura cristata TaxID=143302 RepID=UPI0006431BB0